MYCVLLDFCPTAKKGIRLGYEKDFFSKLEAKRVACFRNFKFEKYTFPSMKHEKTSETSVCSYFLNVAKDSTNQENTDDNTPVLNIQEINSPNSTFWKKSINKEIPINMYGHEVWIIVKKSGEQSWINFTWVFKIKKDQLNLPVEYKARLCVKGFQQVK
ncbi:hypothetical protein VP01_4123g1, partial [Puccinia sorghi]